VYYYVVLMSTVLTPTVLMLDANQQQLSAQVKVSDRAPLTAMLPMLPPPCPPPSKKPRFMDRVTVLSLELSNKGHTVPTDVLQAVLQKNNLELASSGLGFLSVALASSDLAWHSCTNG
jgi:hypothetical protein